MASFVLLPGAGGAGWVWSKVVPLLQAAGHEAIAVDLPGADPKAGLAAYADVVEAAIGDRRGVVLVAQSMGGFTAAQLVGRRPELVSRVIFVNAMIPLPNERANDWGERLGSQPAREAAAQAGGWSTEFDLETYFLHDLAPDVVAGLMEQDGEEAPAAFEDPVAFDGWPAGLPLHVIVGEGDRLFPPAFQARVASERLGVEAELLPGGHLMGLSFPEPLAARLIALAGG